MARLQSAIAAFHIPTLIVALIVGVASGISINGQPVDLSTGQGRATAALALGGLIFATAQKLFTQEAKTNPQLAELEFAVDRLAAVIEAAFPNVPAAVAAASMPAVGQVALTQLPAVTPVSVAPSAPQSQPEPTADPVTPTPAAVPVDPWDAANR